MSFRKSEAERFHRDILEENNKKKKDEDFATNQTFKDANRPPVNNFDVDSFFNNNQQTNRGRQMGNDDRSYQLPRASSNNRD